MLEGGHIKAKVGALQEAKDNQPAENWAKDHTIWSYEPIPVSVSYVFVFVKMLFLSNRLYKLALLVFIRPLVLFLLHRPLRFLCLPLHFR